MNDWHKWSERKPTEADAGNGRLIEWCGQHSGVRWFAAIDYCPYSSDTHWRTPAPLPGEEEQIVPEPTEVIEQRECPECGTNMDLEITVCQACDSPMDPTDKESGPAVADSPGAAPSQEGAVPAAAGSDAWWLRYYVGQAMVFGAGDTPEDVAAHALKDALAALAAVKAQEEGK